MNRNGSRDHPPKTQQQQRNWVQQICCCCLGCWEFIQSSSWPKVVLRKWLNIRDSSIDSDFSADEGEEESLLHHQDTRDWEHEDYTMERGINRFVLNVGTSKSVTCKIRRRKSETFRAEYINTKELRICVGTWNVGGISPPDDLEINEWLDTEEPADIYVLGFQEVVPLNPVNIFGSEDSRPVPKWESAIRKALNKSPPVKSNFKCHSDSPSPSRLNPTNDVSVAEIFSQSDSDSEAEGYPIHDTLGILRVRNSDEGLFEETGEHVISLLNKKHESRKFSSSVNDANLEKTVLDNDANTEKPVYQQNVKLTRNLSCSERVGLGWPEQPLDLLPQQCLGSCNNLEAASSFTASNSYKVVHGEGKLQLERKRSCELNKSDSMRSRRKRSSFIRIASKQMVGIFLSIWVRRSLRKYIKNLKLSSVGVGVMGYIGNKGSISVSMSIYQTLFCFVCAHLSAGEKDGDELRRNSDVREIHQRTQFNVAPGIGLPRTIHDHERVIWLGDLNYRINLSYDKIRLLVSKRKWSKLAKMDQLKRELEKGRAFDGWMEGDLDFPPTYKYEVNSDNYTGYEAKSERRTPAWCDRVLSFGKGLTLLSYRRSELSFSDHRPVTAMFFAEVEVFSHRNL